MQDSRVIQVLVICFLFSSRPNGRCTHIDSRHCCRKKHVDSNGRGPCWCSHVAGLTGCFSNVSIITYWTTSWGDVLEWAEVPWIAGRLRGGPNGERRSSEPMVAKWPYWRWSMEFHMVPSAVRSGSSSIRKTSCASWLNITCFIICSPMTCRECCTVWRASDDVNPEWLLRGRQRLVCVEVFTIGHQLDWTVRVRNVNNLKNIPPVGDAMQGGSSVIESDAFVCDPGVTLASQLSMREYLSLTAHAGFFHLRWLRSVRRLLGRDVTIQLVVALVLSPLDYCNAVLAGLLAIAHSPLQRVIHAAARLVNRGALWCSE